MVVKSLWGADDKPNVTRGGVYDFRSSSVILSEIYTQNYAIITANFNQCNVAPILGKIY